MRLDVNLVGGGAVPDDLAAPFGGPECCGEIWLADLLDVVRAFAGEKPLVSPCCGRDWTPRDLGRIAFVSRAEWDDADDDAPETYYVDSAFQVPAAR